MPPGPALREPLEEAISASRRDVPQAAPLPGDRDQPRRVLPPLLGST
ncbi:MAG: hypothetical protein ACRDP7_38775 [Trebonia sp.]